MTSEFQQDGTNRVVLVIEPDSGEEAMLLALWLGYDANTISASVERREDGRIKAVELIASSSR